MLYDGAEIFLLEERVMNEIYALIRSVGVTSKYKGYYYLADAIYITLNMRVEDGPMKITKDIYPILATKYNVKQSNIEHNIRTVVNICCNNHEAELEKIIGPRANYRFSNADFIDSLAYYLKELRKAHRGTATAESGKRSGLR